MSVVINQIMTIIFLLIYYGVGLVSVSCHRSVILQYEFELSVTSER